MAPTAKFTPEERKARDLESKRRYKEKQRAAKKIDPAQVKRSDHGRTIAETKTGGAPRPSGDVKATSVEEATKRVQSLTTTEEKPSKLAEVLGTTQETRAPTKAEIAMIRSIMDPSNEPLVQIENDLATMGLVGTREEVLQGTKLVERGKIPATEKELETAATLTAGTLVNFAPNLMIYMYPIGLAFFSLTFVGSRLVIFLRLKRATDELEKVRKEAEEAQRGRNKFNPGAQTIAANNGAPAEPARTA